MNAAGSGGGPSACTVEELGLRVGQEIGVSPWRLVAQVDLDRFADATDDHQFIHVDPRRAEAETAFGGTVAHGFLTLSLLSAFAREALPEVAGRRVGVNYGLDRVRFVAPVRSGSRVRGRFVLREVSRRGPAEMLLRHGVTVEIEGAAKPALVAEWLTLAVLG
ncbi:MAG: MaoC domain protein dehydratase [Enterovirga sp.]|nr:MaoC domain protein dehydratase [Enterovirga sp.]